MRRLADQISGLKADEIAANPTAAFGRNGRISTTDGKAVPRIQTFSRPSVGRLCHPWKFFESTRTYVTVLLCCSTYAERVHQREFAKWSMVEITFTGPDSRGRDEPNPFAVRLEVEFTSAQGTQYRVPGFYDGDGNRGLNGNVWKVRFAADKIGDWKYETSSDNGKLNGITGKFRVVKTAAHAQGFWKWGRLESVGTVENRIRYLKFRDGPYWLKAGCDDPENFLGNFRHYDSLAKRKAAVDYLAGRGLNSLYIMTHNIDGDDKDVWPWLGKTQKEAKINGGSNADSMWPSSTNGMSCLHTCRQRAWSRTWSWKTTVPGRD
jgi:hypothetical protein